MRNTHFRELAASGNGGQVSRIDAAVANSEVDEGRKGECAGGATAGERSANGRAAMTRDGENGGKSRPREERGSAAAPKR